MPSLPFHQNFFLAVSEMLLTRSAVDRLKSHCYNKKVKCKNHSQIKEKNSASRKKTGIKELNQHAKGIIQIF